VRRLQYRAVIESHYGTIPIDERMANVINKDGWLEGDLLDFAMSAIVRSSPTSACALFPHLATSSLLLATQSCR
jgi:hypothetical protein